MNLTLKQKLFVDAYLGKANGNATEAARIAGYSGGENALSQRGSELVRNSKITPLIQKKLEQSAMGANEVLTELGNLAKMKWNTKGFRASDKIKALELIGKYHALFTEKHEHTGSLEHRVIKPNADD